MRVTGMSGAAGFYEFLESYPTRFVSVLKPRKGQRLIRIFKNLSSARMKKPPFFHD